MNPSGTFSAIAAGLDFSLALNAQGELFGWGTNPKIPFGADAVLSNVRSISAGLAHALAVKNDGTVWSWGWNYYGQVANGNTDDQTSPNLVTGLPEVAQGSAGGSFSLARTAAGTVFSWGLNNIGELGGISGDACGFFADVPCAHSPIAASVLSGSAAVIAGGAHALRIGSDNSLGGTGNNASGELGSQGGNWGALEDLYLLLPYVQTVQGYCDGIYDDEMLAMLHEKPLPAKHCVPPDTVGSGSSVGSSSSSSGGLTLGWNTSPTSLDAVDAGIAFSAQLQGTTSQPIQGTLSNSGTSISSSTAASGFWVRAQAAR